jgi:hypothetical protein
MNKLNAAGRNGPFRTPRHIIRMTLSPCGMVQMADPQPRERIGDLAGVVRRVEGLRGRMSEAGRHPGKVRRGRCGGVVRVIVE